MSVHNKDIVEHLRNEDIINKESFDWIAQMRYYWGLESKNDNCPLKVKMINSCLNYGFEYLGNINRLVITPLTDRCFRTLMGAYQVKYGGAPEVINKFLLRVQLEQEKQRALRIFQRLLV